MPFGSLLEITCIIAKARAVAKGFMREVDRANNYSMRKWTLALLCLVECLALLLAPFAGLSSAQAQAGPPPAVVINEIHYDPRLHTAGVEYIELYNVGAAAVDLTGWSIAKGIDFVFPVGTWLPAGGYLVVARRPAGMRQVYGIPALGPFTGRLANDGDTLRLRDRDGQTVDEVAYQLGFPWPTPNDDADQSIGLINAGLDNSQPGAWRSGAPTPGWQNSNLTENPPPFIDNVTHSPQTPRSWDTVTIRVHVSDADGVASVRLWLQDVLPGSYIRLTDDAYKKAWDVFPMQAAGNDVYVAQVPQEYRRHRTLVRYRIEAIDAGGRGIVAPYGDDPQPNFAYFVYDGAPTWRGAIVANSGGDIGRVRDYDFNQMRPLSVYQLLAQHQDVVDSQFIPGTSYTMGYMGSDYPWLGTLVVNGVVYDHIRFRARGGMYRYSVGKNHWKFDFTRGHGFQAYDDYGQPYSTRWDKLNFSAVIQHAQRKHRGEQGLFESLAYRIFNLMGVPTSRTNFVHFRVVDDWYQLTDNQYEGDFWGLYLAIENLDGQFLQEHDLPDGNFYDMQNWTGELDNLGDNGVADKSDLAGFMATYTSGSPDTQWWRNVFDLENYYKFRSVLEAVHHYDVDQGKNYYYYLNPVTARWSILPWDLDLTWSEMMFGEGNEPFRDRVLGNPTFNLEYQNYLRELRDLLFNEEQMFPMIDETAAIIDTPSDGLSMVDADRVMWDYNPILASWYVSDDRAVNGKFYELPPNHAFTGMVQLIKEYVQRRSAWIDQTLLTDRNQPNTPSVTYIGPAGYPADQLRIAASGFGDPQGDATFAAMQWRAAEIIRPGLPGYMPNTRWRYEIEQTWLSPELASYGAEVTVPQGACRPGFTCRVRVRMKDTSGRWSHWSPPAEFVAGSPTLARTAQDLHLSEIMYKPAPSSTLPGEDLEYLELVNSGTSTIDLSNMHFVEGIDYQFPTGTLLGPGQYLVLAGHAGYFKSRYGFAPFAEYDKDLSNQGERLLLNDAFGTPVLDVTYSDGGRWPQEADGQGRSLVATGDDPNTRRGWRASTLLGGSPGSPDPVPVVINEVQFDPGGRRIAKVELYNPGAQSADVGGWILSTDRTDVPANWCDLPRGQRIAQGAPIPPGGYLVVDVADIGVSDGVNGANLQLFSAVPGGCLSGYTHGARLPIPVGGATLGRLITSDGREYFAVQRSPTIGSANAGPLEPAVVVSRIAANASDGVQWLEIANTTGAPVMLYDPANLGNHWQVEGVFFPIPSGVTLPAGGRALVTSAEPSDVCLSGRVPPGTRLLGPLPLPLLAGGMSISLAQPTPWGDGVAAGELDHVYYRNETPWPNVATDVVLNRTNLTGFGSEPSNWQGVVAAGFGLPDGPAALPDEATARTALCSFDAFVNQAGQLEIRWVASAQKGAVAFRLLRSPLSSPQSKTIITTEPIAGAQAGAVALMQWIDADADPNQQYVYWLQTVAADDSTSDVAFTTLRAAFGAAYAPFVPQ